MVILKRSTILDYNLVYAAPFWTLFASFHNWPAAFVFFYFFHFHFTRESPLVHLHPSFFPTEQFFFFLQHYHSVGKGPWERRLRAHRQAVPQRARVGGQRQLRHLQRLWEDLGRRLAEPDRDAQCWRPSGGSTRFWEPPRYCFEGARWGLIVDCFLKWEGALTFLCSVRFWKYWVRSLYQWKTQKVIRFYLLTSESYKGMELTSTHCRRYRFALFIAGCISLNT